MPISVLSFDFHSLTLCRALLQYLNAAVMLTPTGVSYAAVNQADLYSRWRRGRGGRGFSHSATGSAVVAAAQALAGQKVSVPAVPVPLPARSPDDPDLYDDDVT